MHDPKASIVKKYGEPHGNRLVGVLWSDGIYETQRSSVEHFFRKFHGYGVTWWILEDIKANGCAYVDIEERMKSGKKRWLRSEISLWFDSPHFTWKNDEQVVLDISTMIEFETQRAWSPSHLR